MTLIAIMCTAIGTAVGSVLQDMQGFRLIMNFIVLPLFFFSSALFPVPDLPGPVRLAERLNPLSYGVDGLRGALSGGFAFGVRRVRRPCLPRRDRARDRRLPVLEDRGIATPCSTQRATFLPSARSAGGGSLERRPSPPSTTGFAPQPTSKSAQASARLGRKNHLRHCCLLNDRVIQRHRSALIIYSTPRPVIPFGRPLRSTSGCAGETARVRRLGCRRGYGLAPCCVGAAAQQNPPPRRAHGVARKRR
jgi:hypothetical protein